MLCLELDKIAMHLQRFIVKGLYPNFSLCIYNTCDVLFVHVDKITSSVKITYQKLKKKVL